MSKIPRQFALVKVESKYTEWLNNNDKESPLLREDVFVFLGEIPNMPEHCVIAGKTSGKIFSGYHTSNFLELSEDEV